VTALADGEPASNSADIVVLATAAQALDVIGDRFDYSWLKSKSGVILLFKRFRKPEERPQMNVPEMRRMARDVAAAANRIPHGATSDAWHATLVALSRTFTSGQAHALQSGKKIYVTDLAPNQRALVREAIVTRMFAIPATGALELAAKLVSLEKSSLRFSESGVVKSAGKTVRRFMVLHASGPPAQLTTPLGFVDFAPKGDEG
jgi:hypothetical protein